MVLSDLQIITISSALCIIFVAIFFIIRSINDFFDNERS